MPEESKVVPAPFQPFVVKRNDVELKFEPIAIKRAKDKTKVLYYPGVKVDSSNIATVVKWLDNDHLISMCRGKMNQRFQGLFREATTEADGVTPKPFDVEEFRALAEQFSARGEKISEINEEIEELNDELASMATEGTLTIEAAMRIGTRVKQLILARESKRRTREDNEDAETTTVKAVS